MKRAAVYLRMSLDDQTASPERQKSLILPYCQRQRYEIVETYQDDGRRGWDDTRPDFQRLLKDAARGKFDVIVVDESSRLSRQDPLDFIVTVAQPLRQAGVAVETVDDGKRHTWDGDDLSSLLLGFINQHKAAQESITLGRRVLTGQARSAKTGSLFTGRAPVGYRYRLNERGERVDYEVHPEEAGIVRRIFDLYVNQDLSILAIVTRLNAEGVPSPRGER